jgi:diacylglycerol kinase (ATP)
MSHFFKAFRWSMQGFRACYRTEISFRQEVWLFAALFPVSFIVSKSVNDFLWLVMPMCLVLLVELLNTAIENTIDKAIKKQSKKAGMAKDQGSAAVFVALTFLGISWAAILLKNFTGLFH